MTLANILLLTSKPRCGSYTCVFVEGRQKNQVIDSLSRGQKAFPEKMGLKKQMKSQDQLFTKSYSLDALFTF